MAVTAVLLDVDGTLVDSSYLHVLTWTRALAEAGHPRAGSAVQRQIGKDGELLLQALLGEQLAGEIGSQLSERRLELYLQRRDELRPLPGAVELVSALVRRGLAVVLATSASPQERDVLLEVLDLPVEVTAVTDADDAETAKPRPDLVQVALQRAGAEASAAVMVGDAVWDVQGGARAGVPVVGLLTGGIAECELRDAGAVAVYDGAAALLEQLEDSPLTR